MIQNMEQIHPEDLIQILSLARKLKQKREKKERLVNRTEEDAQKIKEIMIKVRQGKNKSKALES